MRMKALILSSIMAGGILFAAPAGASPLVLAGPVASQKADASLFVQVDQRRGNGRRGYHSQNGKHYYNGHRGQRRQRQGYRQFNGWWFPPAAFSFGFGTGPAYVQPPRYAPPPRYAAPPRHARGYSPAHYQWCDQRYRSYRASDNSFQPYNGPRRACVSPYVR
ncbi:BA14K family protein [uncultured Roseibium sp.]|uniref:BA14K family protein n=1 Tax=uncultured Roseibium sp. TaxID=1936171 RepID=UPI00260517B9|nr:BA14K family protein [uncultured Roseibium sp.]